MSNDKVDVFHELNELHNLIWEYGDDCICLHEGSEDATVESTDEINKKFEIIKREIEERNMLIRELTNALSVQPVCSGKCDGCFTKEVCRFYKERELIKKALEVVK